MQDDILSFFAKYIEKELGIIYSDYNLFQLKNRLEEVCKYFQYDNLETLYKTAQKEIKPDLKTLILDTATNNETYFFRDPKVFEAIDMLLQKLLSQPVPPQEINIWSAASSSGQEALSVAMICFELSEKFRSKVKINIIATDISSKILDKAKKGKFTQLEVQRGLSTLQLLKYFDKVGDSHWQVKSHIISFINFKEKNLLNSFDDLVNFDFILCRNVLIYQNIENKIKIIQKISQKLKNDGYLILGAGESLIGLSSDFEQEIIQSSLLYKNRNNLIKKAA